MGFTCPPVLPADDCDRLKTAVREGSRAEIGLGLEKQGTTLVVFLPLDFCEKAECFLNVKSIEKTLVGTRRYTVMDALKPDPNSRFATRTIPKLPKGEYKISISQSVPGGPPKSIYEMRRFVGEQDGYRKELARYHEHLFQQSRTELTELRSLEATLRAAILASMKAFDRVEATVAVARGLMNPPRSWQEAGSRFRSTLEALLQKASAWDSVFLREAIWGTHYLFLKKTLEESLRLQEMREKLFVEPNADENTKLLESVRALNLDLRKQMAELKKQVSDARAEAWR